LAIGGTDDDWLLVGVCRLCAYLSHRPGVKPDLLAELDGGLEGTRYTLPTPVQLLGTNGHQHTALLGALAARGVVLLPAPHYGFMAASPEGMTGWCNSAPHTHLLRRCRVATAIQPHDTR
jgi:hypothetical protein